MRFAFACVVMQRQVTSIRAILWEPSTPPMNFAPIEISGGSTASTILTKACRHFPCPQAAAVVAATQQWGAAALRLVVPVAEVARRALGLVVTEAVRQ